MVTIYTFEEFKKYIQLRYEDNDLYFQEISPVVNRENNTFKFLEEKHGIYVEINKPENYNPNIIYKLLYKKYLDLIFNKLIK